MSILVAVKEWYERRLHSSYHAPALLWGRPRWDTGTTRTSSSMEGDAMSWADSRRERRNSDWNPWPGNRGIETPGSLSLSLPLSLSLIDPNCTDGQSYLIWYRASLVQPYANQIFVNLWPLPDLSLCLPKWYKYILSSDWGSSWFYPLATRYNLSVLQ